MATPAAQRSSHNTDAEYNLPNDTVEHNRLEDQAAGFADLMHNRVIHAPLRNPHRLLDIGCGTNAVTHHLAATYPTASHIYGLDLSPVPHIHRPRAAPTANVTYIQGDVKKLSRTDERLAAGS
ncbi:hypothetical protein HO133_003175 [Letharia lupina]|uniref:Methyltransferase domain-containing protein n=1 Tax=Letharia lupina TaxID=560253 RepID=A0A8H6CC30_9LECA|nr:uncharacterized protein HO133_003175 [Letharia lupina]KAF6220742.1 hypothetical protein HO133_003175 [Letharia lupina]